jgi:hypothetical protein
MVEIARAPKVDVVLVADHETHAVVLTDKSLVRVSGDETTPIVATPPFEFSHDAVLHSNGNFYVTDGYAHAIRQIIPDGKVSALVKGEPLKSPQGPSEFEVSQMLDVRDPRSESSGA